MLEKIKTDAYKRIETLCENLDYQIEALCNIKSEALFISYLLFLCESQNEEFKKSTHKP